MTSRKGFDNVSAIRSRNELLLRRATVTGSDTQGYNHADTI